MLKKIMVLCCAAFLAMGASAHAGETAAQITPEQELLIALDIMSLNSYGEIDNEKEVTRAEFADVCGKLLGINPSITANKAYFSDVMPGDWYAHTVNTLAELGIVSQPENGLFEPERAITFNEAIKMITCIMGYGDYAESAGGYPNGYISAASQQGILDGVGDMSGSLTEGAMSRLVYNALHASVMKKELGGMGADYVIDDNETLMSYYLDVYEDDGTVESVFGMSLTDAEAPEDRVIIDGTEYYIGDVGGMTDRLGYRIKFYYRLGADDTRTLVYAEPLRTSELLIRSEDIENFGGLGGALEYIDGTRHRNAAIASDASVIRNGAVVKSGVDEAFDITNGELRLIDGDGDGTYETAVIYDYETVVVNMFNPDKGIISDAMDPRLMIDISECRYVSVFSETGDKLDVSAITTGTVVDIAYSKDHAFIYVNSGNFEGTIESIDTASREITVNGTAYKYLQKAYDRYQIKASYTGVFKTNKFGEVAYFEYSGGGSLPGYVLNSAYVDELREQLMLKVLTSAGTVEWINLNENASKDGEKIGANLDSLASLKEKVILYTINSDGEITQIDSSARGANEDETSLSLEMPLNDGGYRWTAGTRMFGKNIICSPDAIVFKVPPATSQFRDDDSYSVVTLSSLTSNRMLKTEAYKYGSTSYCGIVVYYDTKYTNKTSDELIFVTQVNIGVNEEQEDVYYIKGYQKGSLITLEANRPRDVLPKPGDCIRVARDNNGQVGLIEIHYDIERNGSGMCDPEAYWYWAPVDGEPYDAINKYWNGTFSDIQADFRLGFGYPVQIDGDILKWSFHEDSDSVDELAAIDSSVPIIVYEAADDAFYEGTLDDVKTQEVYGGDCSIIIVNYHWGEPTALFVINNRDAVYG